MHSTERLIKSGLRRRTPENVRLRAKASGVDRHQVPYVASSASRDVRVGPLLSIPSLLREHELDPSRVLARVGLDARLFDDAENRVSFRDLGRLLETCIKLTGCQHFGLLIGQRFKISSLGLLGELMRNCPSLRDALRLAALYLELHDRGAVSLTLDLGREKVALGYSLFEGKTSAAAQILDGAIAMQCLLLRELCGRSWKPVLVQLSHSQPTEIAPFRKHFRAPLEFDAQISSIVFDARWLDRPITGADPAAFAAVSRVIESMQPQLMTFAARARRALYAMMFTGSASSTNLARLFNMHERTLRRNLEEEHATVRGLICEARRELAQHLLRDTNLSVSEIAAALRYSDVSVFARAFRGWSRMSPSAWRAKYAGVS